MFTFTREDALLPPLALNRERRIGVNGSPR